MTRSLRITVHHATDVPPLPSRLHRVPADEGARPLARRRTTRSRTARLTLRAAVTSVLTMLAVGVPVVSGGLGKSAVEASSAWVFVAPRVVRGGDAPPPTTAETAPPAPESVRVEAPPAPAAPAAEPAEAAAPADSAEPAEP